MALDVDQEILQDFLVEAGEILEELSEQLVELEQTPEDLELLNAVFRGFHTIKGGASFLSLKALVDVCHVAEDVFNRLRNQEIVVDQNLMDVVLRVVDSVHDMIEEVQQDTDPTPAPLDLIEHLKELAGDSQANTVEEAPKEVDTVDSAEPDLSTASGVKIDDDEFEKILDKLHGPGAGPSSGESHDSPTQAEAVEAEDGAEPPQEPIKGISDDEFENVLDSLYGAGKGPSTGAELADKSVTSISALSQSNEKSATTNLSAEKKSSSKAKEGKQAQGEGTVRVDTARLDDIMNMVGELVLVRNRIINLGETIEEQALSEAIGNLDLVTSNLQSAVMKTRMQPIKKVFGRFPRVVRDLARNLGKDIRLELEGEETDLDKNLVEALADPLVHLVRNACDHGIESPEQRTTMGKSPHGTVRLSASQEGDHILLSIHDDGAGMDPDLLRQKAVEKGVMDEEAALRLDERECFDLIFQPGFSTKHIISDVSGRGVGMDVVKTKISSLNGTIVIDSQKGVGTNLMIKVPLTLAIMPTLMVMLGGQAFAFPLASVSEIFNLDLSQTNVVDGQMVVTVRNKPLPLFYLNEWLKPNEAPLSNTHNAHVVVVNLANQKVGFVVNKLLGQEEVVIKPLGAFLHGTPGMAGATITGDGRIALILDVPSLVQFYAKRAA